MIPPSLSHHEWEQAEVERSAFEAAHVVDRSRLIADEAQIRRYLDPPADTIFPLEYAYHLLGDARGKIVLEYGSGDGVNTVALAKRGAKVKALDISPDLIEIARQRLEANQITGDVEFIVGSAHEIPLPDESVDVVFGIAILHHLDLAQSAREVRRVLRPGGRAIFQEPMRNSRLLKFVRKLIPYQAPDVSPFERPLTDAELTDYAKDFASCHRKAFWLPTVSLTRILPIARKFASTVYKYDSIALEKLPLLSHYATIRVMQVVK